jgi:oligoribonuclease NrnB/cAMP/cGMP phosphodiesterase (DHH superfamily)
MDKRLVLYHDDADGFAAAYCVWKKFGDTNNVFGSTSYKAVKYGYDVISYWKKYDELIIVDFSYPREIMDEMFKHFGSKMLVLDHHKSAQADCQDASYCKFNMNQSGCMMAWNHFINNYNPHNTAPPIIQYVEDFDLWRFQFGETTRVVGAWLRSRMPWTFEQWNAWMEGWIARKCEFIAEGTAIRRYEMVVVSRACHKPDMYKWTLPNNETYTVPIVNTRIMQSEIGNKLSQDYPFSATYYEKHGKRMWSLRSASDGVDVSEIAKQFAGGGHVHAAGFETESSPDMRYTLLK